MPRDIVLEYDFATFKIKPKSSFSRSFIILLKKFLDKYDRSRFIDGDEVINKLKKQIKDHNSIGFNIRVYRNRLDMTQEELAKKTKMAQGDVSKFENNKLVPGVRVAKKLAKVLKCDYHEFL